MHTCRQGCDTEPDLDLSRNGRGYRQQIADEQERDDDEIDHQRPHGDLPLGRGLCQQLAYRKPESERERVEYHEKHPRPADQDGLSGLCHTAALSRADDPTAVGTRPIASVVMALSATRSSLAEHATVPTPTMTTLCLPSGVQSVAIIGTIKDARPIEPTPTRTERSSSEWGDRRRA